MIVYCGIAATTIIFTTNNSFSGIVRYVHVDNETFVVTLRILRYTSLAFEGTYKNTI